MTTRTSAMVLATLVAGVPAGPAAATTVTHFEDFNAFPDNTYIETKLPGAYVTDGFAFGGIGCTTGCNRILTSFNYYDAVQIDFDVPQDYVSFTSATLNGLQAFAFSYAYGPKDPIWLDYLVVGDPSTGVQTLRSPIPGVPTPYNHLPGGASNYRPLIQTVVFTHINGSGAWAIDNLTWSTTVPEPATWALMLGGFGLAGGALRRARRRGTGMVLA